MNLLVRKYKNDFAEPEPATPAPQAPPANNDSQSSLVEALLAVAGKKPKELIHIDLAAELEKHGLQELFPVGCWPPTNAVRKFASKRSKLMKLGVVAPFIYVDFRECAFLDFWRFERLSFCVRAGCCRRISTTTKQSFVTAKAWLRTGNQRSINIFVLSLRRLRSDTDGTYRLATRMSWTSRHGSWLSMHMRWLP